MCPYVSYIHCDTYSKGKNVNIIMFVQFEKGDLLSETRVNAESYDKSGDKSDGN